MPKYFGFFSNEVELFSVTPSFSEYIEIAQSYTSFGKPGMLINIIRVLAIYM
jgi:hypothetical protein